MIESIVMFIALTLLSRHFVGANPQRPFIGLSESVGTAFGAAAGSFVREVGGFDDRGNGLNDFNRGFGERRFNGFGEGRFNRDRYNEREFDDGYGFGGRGHGFHRHGEHLILAVFEIQLKNKNYLFNLSFLG